MLDNAAPDDDEAPELREGRVEAAQHGERLDKAVVALVPEFSRSHLQELIRGGWVHLDGVPCVSPAQRVRAGQRLAATLQPTAESRAYRAEALPLAVVHEDDDVLVIDKAPGMVVHPAAGNWSGTVLNALLARDPASAGLPRAGIVHRLDKDTSGLMVIGRNLGAVTALVRAIAAREVKRRYLAIAHGVPPAAPFSIEAPVGRDPRLRTRMAVVESGKPARTDVERLAARDGMAALRCTLHTGRTHQIRVHLAWRGWPLVGDRLYGGASALGIDRQALHAAELAFAHPRTGRALAFEARPPDDLAAAWGYVTDRPLP
ncbi:MAG TPA: RluA family pseudouridine synthase [Caldimonas sp.]|jgi:23S rRNA pseudouridine1911/1915/1917 synthase|nr:RluA family pseudouridine synthase [Caldimonas sp.]HEX2542815.1 RluA family pseudouridine synthase [Caldimonas sp.]